MKSSLFSKKIILVKNISQNNYLDITTRRYILTVKPLFKAFCCEIQDAIIYFYKEIVSEGITSSKSQNNIKYHIL